MIVKIDMYKNYSYFINELCLRFGLTDKNVIKQMKSFVEIARKNFPTPGVEPGPAG